MRKILVLSCLFLSTISFAQSYRVTIETFVGNKSEDKFSFTMAQGEEQFKGFDGKLLAKRYRANGFPHKVLAQEEARIKYEESLDKEAALKPAERVKKWLEKARSQYSSYETRYSKAESQKEMAEAKIKELEELESLAARGSSSFRSAYFEYLKKNGLTDEDLKVKKMMNKRPRDTGDVEEIDFGSFCKIKLTKVADKKLTFDFDYSFSRIMAYFYSDGNNNSNTITKHPIVERFEKLGVKDLSVTIGKPYCFQFTRLSPTKARSLSEAVASTGIFSGDGEAKSEENTPVDPELTSLDAQGALASIKRKYASESGKVARVVISVRVDN